LTDSNVGNGQLAGKCGCGAVRYRVADEFLYAANCHCSRCRAATGSAFKPFAGIEREKLEITDGLDRLLVFGEEDSKTRAARRVAPSSSPWCGTAPTFTSRWGRS
jgi:hypothetical protein